MLTFNPMKRTFFVTSEDEKRAKAVGLSLSKNARSARGERIWYTAEYNGQPCFNPYAALPYWDEADSAAKKVLAPYKKDYDLSWATETNETFPVPEGLSYLPYQNAGIRYAIDKGNCLIGDEPGLGKTIQAIGISNTLRAKKTLVICPANIRLNWQREIRNWSVIRGLSTYPVLRGGQGVNPDCNYVIISYDLIKNPGIHEALCAEKWDHLILDEIHYLKSLDAQRTRAIFGGGDGIFKLDSIARHASRVTGLSGTPLPNRPRECYTVARALNWDAIDFQSFEAFKYRYNPSNAWGEEVGRLPELQSRLRCNLMVRRHKADVLKDLPDKRYEMVYVEPNGEIRGVLAKERLLDFDPRQFLNGTFKIDGPIATVRREMGEAMAPRAAEHVRYLLDIVGVDKLILVGYHTSVLDILQSELHQYGVIRRDGSTSATKKDQDIWRFVKGPDRVFLAQIDTLIGADGLQQATDWLVAAEPAWNPGANEQAVDRLHRMGQPGSVTAQFLLAEGSFNEKVLNINLTKARNVHGALDKHIGDR